MCEMSEGALELVRLLCQYPDTVVTMRSAFYIYDLTDVIPDGYDLAAEKGAKRIYDKRIRQYYCPSDFFREGIERIDYKGYPIPIYSRERMLIELIQNRKKLPFDYYKEVVLNYRKILPRLDIQELQDYALAAPQSDRIIEALQLEVF